MERDGQRAVFSDGAGCRVVCPHRRVTLSRSREIDGRFGEHERAFRHPDQVCRLLGCNRERQRLRIGESDILGGEDDDPPGDEHRVFAGFEHSREPVDRCVRVGPAHRFDERGDGVEVRVSAFVIGQRSLSDARHGLNGDDAIASLSVADGCFQRVERNSRIAAAELGESIERICVDGDRALSESAVGVVEGMVQECENVITLQGFEFEHPSSAQERSDHLERWILRRRADQGDCPILDRVEDSVLLGLVESMNLVDEEDHPREPVSMSRLGVGDHLAQVGDATGDGGERRKAGVGESGDHSRDRGFAAARRSPEDAGRGCVGLDRAAERCVGSDEMRLSDDFVEAARSHPSGERRVMINRLRHFEERRRIERAVEPGSGHVDSVGVGLSVSVDDGPIGGEMTNEQTGSGAHQRMVATKTEDGVLYVDLDEYNAILSDFLHVAMGEQLVDLLMGSVPQLYLRVEDEEDDLADLVIDVVGRFQCSIGRNLSQPSGGDLTELEDLQVTFTVRSDEE